MNIRGKLNINHLKVSHWKPWLLWLQTLYPIEFMEQLTKKQKRQLRELTEIAYEKDLAKCQEELAEKFDAWRKKDITVWDLDKFIHEYHHDKARFLHKNYTLNNPFITVGFGIVRGVISIDEVDESIKERMQDLVDVMKM